MQTWQERIDYSERFYTFNNKPEEAAQNFQKLIDADCYAALLHMARLYSGPLNDKEKAADYSREAKKHQQWFEEQAYEGSPEAQYHLAVFYSSTKELDKAINYYKLAADNGHPMSKCCLGEMYFRGNGVEKNLEIAENLVKPIADLGYFAAKLLLSEIYWSQKRYPEAVTYCLKNLQENYGEVYNMLGNAYTSGKGIDEDQEKAFYYYDLAAKQNLPYAQFMVGQYYFFGRVVKQDEARGFALFEKAAAADVAQAQYVLGQCYFSGKIVTKNEATGLIFFEKAAVGGNSNAQFFLAKRHYYGIGVEKDIVKGLEFFEKAAAGGNPEAKFILGEGYYFGEDIEKDEIKGYKLCKEAADAGSVNALYFLGYYHWQKQCEKGIWSEVKEEFDVFLAKNYLVQAKAKGHPKANDLLANIEAALIPFEQYFTQQPSNKAIHLLKLVQYHQALDEAIKKNDPDTQYSFGHDCLIGKYRSNEGKDLIKEGIKFIQAAAAQKHYGALMLLIESYVNGINSCSKDLPTALEYCSHIDPLLRSGKWWHSLAIICSELELSDFKKMPDNLKFIMDGCLEGEIKFIQLKVRYFCLSEALKAYTEAGQKEDMNVITGLRQLTQYNLDNFGKEKRQFARRIPLKQDNSSQPLTNCPQIMYPAKKDANSVPDSKLNEDKNKVFQS
jgi:TPR repeat protein